MFPAGLHVVKRTRVPSDSERQKAKVMSETVSDFLVRRLKEWGVQRLYGYPGDGINGILGALNRAAAVAMRDGPAAGLALVDSLMSGGELDEYPLAHSARGELCRRLGRLDQAAQAYTKALMLTRQEPQRRFLERRLQQISSSYADSRPAQT